MFSQVAGRVGCLYGLLLFLLWTYCVKGLSVILLLYNRLHAILTRIRRLTATTLYYYIIIRRYGRCRRNSRCRGVQGRYRGPTLDQGVHGYVINMPYFYRNLFSVICV